jgi:hypothetical protein
VIASEAGQFSPASIACQAVVNAVSTPRHLAEMPSKGIINIGSRILSKTGKGNDRITREIIADCKQKMTKISCHPVSE